MLNFFFMYVVLKYMFIEIFKNQGVGKIHQLSLFSLAIQYLFFLFYFFIPFSWPYRLLFLFFSIAYNATVNIPVQIYMCMKFSQLLFRRGMLNYRLHVFSTSLVNTKSLCVGCINSQPYLFINTWYWQDFKNLTN